MTPTIAQRVQKAPSSATVRIADLAASLLEQGVQVLDFSAGRAAEHTPPYICDVAMQALAQGDTHQTMAQGKLIFRQASARKLARENGLSVDPHSEVIATLGCKQGLLLALMATINIGDEILVEDPGFVSYQPTIRFCGGVPIPVPLVRVENGFRWCENDLQTAITERTRAIVFCSPHNPTGIVHMLDDLNVIADLAMRHNLMVIADETYERLTWGDRTHTSIATLPGMSERTIGLMGLTKAFCMGGWRIGLAYAPAPVIEAMVVVQQHLATSAGSFAQTAAAHALGEPPPSCVRTLWKDWEKRCRHVVSGLNALPNISCAMPESGFYAWIDVSATGWPSEPLAEHLLREHHVALVPGAAFGPHGEGYLRMTCVKSWDDLHAGLVQLKGAFSNLGPPPLEHIDTGR